MAVSQSESADKRVIVKQLPPTATGPEFFNHLEECLYFTFKCHGVLKSVDILDDKVADDGSKTANVVCRHPIVASVLICLDGMEWRGAELENARPDDYEEPEGGDPAGLIEIHEGINLVLHGRSLAEHLPASEKAKPEAATLEAGAPRYSWFFELFKTRSRSAMSSSSDWMRFPETEAEGANRGRPRKRVGATMG